MSSAGSYEVGTEVGTDQGTVVSLSESLQRISPAVAKLKPAMKATVSEVKTFLVAEDGEHGEVWEGYCGEDETFHGDLTGRKMSSVTYSKSAKLADLVRSGYSA